MTCSGGFRPVFWGAMTGWKLFGEVTDCRDADKPRKKAPSTAFQQLYPILLTQSVQFSYLFLVLIGRLGRIVTRSHLCALN